MSCGKQKVGCDSSHAHKERRRHKHSTNRIIVIVIVTTSTPSASRIANMEDRSNRTEFGSEEARQQEAQNGTRGDDTSPQAAAPPAPAHHHGSLDVNGDEGHGRRDGHGQGDGTARNPVDHERQPSARVPGNRRHAVRVASSTSALTTTPSHVQRESERHRSFLSGAAADGSIAANHTQQQRQASGISMRSRETQDMMEKSRAAALQPGAVAVAVEQQRQSTKRYQEISKSVSSENGNGTNSNAVTANSNANRATNSMISSLRDRATRRDVADNDSMTHNSTSDLINLDFHDGATAPPPPQPTKKAKTVESHSDDLHAEKNKNGGQTNDSEKDDKVDGHSKKEKLNNGDSDDDGKEKKKQNGADAFQNDKTKNANDDLTKYKTDPDAEASSSFMIMDDHNHDDNFDGIGGGSDVQNQRNLGAPGHRQNTNSAVGATRVFPRGYVGDGSNDDEESQVVANVRSSHHSESATAASTSASSNSNTNTTNGTIVSNNPLVAELVSPDDDVRDAIRNEIRQEYQGQAEAENGYGMHGDHADIFEAPLVAANVMADEPEDFDTEEKRKQRQDADEVERKTKRRRMALAGMGILLLIGIAALIVSLLLSRSDGSNSSSDAATGGVDIIEISSKPTASPTTLPPTLSPSGLPSAAPTETLETKIINLIGPLLAGPPTFTKMSSFTDPTTTSFQAIDWMAKVDNRTSDILSSDRENKPRVLLIRYIMVSLYLSTNGPDWTRQYNFMTDKDVCEWNDGTRIQSRAGVWCGDQLDRTDIDDEVVVLALAENRLNGSMPLDLYLLTHMQVLAFGLNDVSVTIPSYVGEMDKLHYAWLGSTQLGGTLPTEIGKLTDMTLFSVYRSSMHGSIPSEIGNWRQLEVFEVSETQITGTIPSELGHLGQLMRLDIGNTQMMGTIPTEVGHLSKLINFKAANAGFNGTLPTEFGNCNELNRMYLNYNQLTGTVPSELGQLPWLSHLYLEGNGLFGELPAELGTAASIFYVSIHSNNIVGDLDPLFCDENVPGIERVVDVESDCRGNDTVPAQTKCTCCDLCCDDVGCDGTPFFRLEW